MPKSHLRRNAAEGIYRRFNRYLHRRRAFAPPLEMAVGQALQRYLLALVVQKPWNRQPRDDRPYAGHGHSGLPCRMRERLKAILGDSAHDLIVVAAANEGFKADIASREQRCSGAGQWNAPGIDNGGYAGCSAEFCEIPGQAIG